MTRRSFKVADLFCGAGSLSQGAHDALLELGRKPHFVAVNHWPVAIDTYARNHPGASVHCVSLDAASPSELVEKGALDLLMAGIECTYFSRARGAKPVTDQQRMSAWHVVRWCTELDVKRLLLENVPEFQDWGPVDTASGRPIKERKGEYFRAWVNALQAIGFKLEWRVLNCADYGDATTRRRLFMLADRTRRDGKIFWPVATYGPNARREWRGFDQCVDWSLPGESIFTRKRPLAPKTLARIATGISKFRWPEPFLIVLRRHADARGISLPLPALCAGGQHIALVQPFVLSQASGGAPRKTSNPLPTIPCGGAHALITPYYGSGSGRTCTTIKRPLPTATTKARFGIVMPVTHNDPSNRARSIKQPLPTLTTAKRGEQALVTPGKDFDIYFRMLAPHELAAAMSISTKKRPYHFAGNKTDVVRQIGQAVPRRTGKALAMALLTGGREA
ncbi:MAG: DNA cytosine methyltransferase [Pseudolabrys sp.]